MLTNDILSLFGDLDPKTLALYKGILGGPSAEEKSNAVNMGLLHTGLGLLGRKNIGDAGILGVQAGQGYLDKGVTERKNNLAAAMQMMQLKKQMEGMDALRKFTSGQSNSPVAPQSALTEGAAQGDVGPTVTNAARIPQQAAGNNQPPNFAGLVAAGVAPEIVKTIMEDWKLRNEPATIHNGYAIPPMRGLNAPQLMPGISTSQNGQTSMITPGPGGIPNVSAPPGALATYNQYQDAGERSKARYDLVTTPPLSINSPPTRGSRLDALGIGGYPLAPQPTTPAPAPAASPPSPSAFPRIDAATQTGRNAEQISYLQRELMQPVNSNPRDQDKIKAEIAKLQSPSPFNPAGANPLPVPNVAGISLADEARAAANKEFQVTDAKARSELYGKMQSGAMANQSKIAKFERIGQLLGDYSGGRLADTGFELARLGTSLGIQIDPKLPNKEASNALTNEVALELRSTADGAGMPGAMSDADRQFLKSMAPQLSQTAEGRKQIIESRVAVWKREQKVAEMARQYKQKHGSIDEDFFSQLQGWSDRNPIFQNANR